MKILSGLPLFKMVTNWIYRNLELNFASLSMLPPFKIVTRKRKGDQILHFLWVECAPSCTWVRGGGGQTNIGRGSGSIQWFVYDGGVCKGIKVVINTI